MIHSSHHAVRRLDSPIPAVSCINCFQCSCHNLTGLQHPCPVPEHDQYIAASHKEYKFMKQVLDAFKSLLKPGEPLIGAKEFSEMWSTCSDELKEALKANAAEMGFVGK